MPRKDEPELEEQPRARWLTGGGGEEPRPKHRESKNRRREAAGRGNHRREGETGPQARPQERKETDRRSRRRGRRWGKWKARKNTGSTPAGRERGGGKSKELEAKAKEGEVEMGGGCKPTPSRKVHGKRTSSAEKGK